MTIQRLATFLTALAMLLMPLPAQAAPAAKKLFGARQLPAAMAPKVHGFYSRGCVQGAVAIPIDGPTWQAMRLSRNRRWGHPELVATVVEISKKAKKRGWNGLLVGDLSQPRGGPMLTGHASHQIGLDADIWLNPMPNRRYTWKERENTSAISMLHRKANGRLDQNRISSGFTKAHFNVIKTAAEMRNVQRVLVHPTIKKQLCKMETADRRWLWKVRPYWGHHYHMHVRLRCPKGSPNCRPQGAVAANDGCGKELADWHRLLNPKPRKKTAKKTKPAKKRKPKRAIRLADLPQACAVVLNASAPANEQAATISLRDGVAFAPTLKAARPAQAAANVLLGVGKIATPTFRPGN